MTRTGADADAALKEPRQKARKRGGGGGVGEQDEPQAKKTGDASAWGEEATSPQHMMQLMVMKAEAWQREEAQRRSGEKEGGGGGGSEGGRGLAGD